MSVSRGCFIVAEGVDGTGKTTALRTVAALVAGRVVYRAGFSRDSRWRRFINRHPSSVWYYLDFVLQTRRIRHLVRNGYIVLQDRYVQSVDSFLPDARYKINRVIRWLIRPFLLKPDLYLWFTAEPSTIQKRLAEKCRVAPDSYDALLAADIVKIRGRAEEYQRIFEDTAAAKLVVDTTSVDPRSVASIIVTHLNHFLCL